VSHEPFPIDRDCPPRRVVCRAGGREIVLRPYELDDVDGMIAAVDASEPELRAWMPWSHLPRTREGEFDIVRGFVADYWAGKQYVMGVFSPAGDVLGGVGLHPRTPLNARALEVGYWVHSAHAGKGIVTQAVRAAVVLAFDFFDCDRLQVQHDVDNGPSQRVVERCGFVHEGGMRNAITELDPKLYASGFKGTRTSRCYALLPGDLANLDWLAELRRETTLVDALGGPPRKSPFAAP
jgi:RimJ/RimL family protein N-acetyltransferase